MDDDYKVQKTVTTLPKGDEVVTTYHNQRPTQVSPAIHVRLYATGERGGFAAAGQVGRRTHQFSGRFGWDNLAPKNYFHRPQKKPRGVMVAQVTLNHFV